MLVKFSDQVYWIAFHNSVLPDNVWLRDLHPVARSSAKLLVQLGRTLRHEQAAAAGPGRKPWLSNILGALPKGSLTRPVNAPAA